MRDNLRRNLVVRQVLLLSKLAQVLCFQEVHGTMGDILAQFRHWLPGWAIFASCCFNDDGSCNPSAGGLVTAICPAICEVAICESQIIIPGRSSCVSILSRGKVLSVLNVHNYGLTFREAKIIRDFLRELRVSIEDEPTKAMGLLVGDLNIKAEHEKSFKIGSALERCVADGRFQNPLFSGQRLGLWKGILSMGTEVIQPMPTHFDFACKSCSRIDRAWAFGPSNLLIKIQVRSHVVGTPEEYYGLGLSDHAPLVVSLGCSANSSIVSNCEYSVPKFVCKHPKFRLL